MISNDILTICAFRLLEQSVKTTLTSSVAAPGDATPNCGSTKEMYVNCQIIVGSGVTREVVTVTQILSATQFRAVFAFAHNSGEAVVGATFPAGHLSVTDKPFFTQAQMLNALAETQNSFLLATRPLYSTASETFTASNRVYNKPATAVRIEHIHFSNSALRPVSQTDLDLGNRNWVADSGKPPRTWFEDQLDPSKYGIDRIPGVDGSAELWFSVRGPVTLALDTTLTVPDIFWPAMVYGTLVRAWGADGEAQNLTMAKYCEKHFQFIVELAKRFVGDFQIIRGQIGKMPTLAVAAGGS